MAKKLKKMLFEYACDVENHPIDTQTDDQIKCCFCGKKICKRVRMDPYPLGRLRPENDNFNEALYEDFHGPSCCIECYTTRVIPAQFICRDPASEAVVAYLLRDHYSLVKKIVRRNIEEADAASNGVESDKYHPDETGDGISSGFFDYVGLDLWEHADKQISDLEENPECIRDVLSAIAFVNTNATDIGKAVYLGVYGDI